MSSYSENNINVPFLNKYATHLTNKCFNPVEFKKELYMFLNIEKGQSSIYRYKELATWTRRAADSWLQSIIFMTVLEELSRIYQIILTDYGLKSVIELKDLLIKKLKKLSTFHFSFDISPVKEPGKLDTIVEAGFITKDDTWAIIKILKLFADVSSKYDIAVPILDGKGFDSIYSTVDPVEVTKFMIMHGTRFIPVHRCNRLIQFLKSNNIVTKVMRFAEEFHTFLLVGDRRKHSAETERDYFPPLEEDTLENIVSVADFESYLLGCLFPLSALSRNIFVFDSVNERQEEVFAQTSAKLWSDNGKAVSNSSRDFLKFHISLEVRKHLVLLAPFISEWKKLYQSFSAGKNTTWVTRSAERDFGSLLSFVAFLNDKNLYEAVYSLVVYLNPVYIDATYINYSNDDTSFEILPKKIYIKLHELEYQESLIECPNSPLKTAFHFQCDDVVPFLTNTINFPLDPKKYIRELLSKLGIKKYQSFSGFARFRFLESKSESSKSTYRSWEDFSESLVSLRNTNIDSENHEVKFE